MFKRLSNLVLVALLLTGGGVWAEVVRDLHSARVPVANQSSSALASASRDALAEVWVKGSGTEGVLSQQDVVAALPQARGHTYS